MCDAIGAVTRAAIGLAWLALAAPLLAGCAAPPAADQGARVSVNVSALSTEEAAGLTRYVLWPANENITPTNLQFREYAEYINRALKQQGFNEVESLDEADIVLMVVYGIGDPEQHLRTYRVPQFGQTGVASATTRGTMTYYGGYGTYTGTTTYQPRWGITGYTTHVESRTTFTRSLGMMAVHADAVHGKQVEELWTVSVVSVGPSGDLRRIFPVMVAAAQPYLGVSTERAIQIQLREEADEVIAIRDGMEAIAPVEE